MDVDTSMFNAADAFDIGLQRTAHFKSNVAFRLWAKGFPFLLQLESRFRKTAIIEGAIADAKREFSTIVDFLGARSITKIVDIGCGHALIDLFFYRKFGCAVHLIDIEETDSHHHDFHQSGAGYGSLSSAQKYLAANGVPPSSITLTNPKKQTPVEENCDLIFSLLSCGFHYPAATYEKFLHSSLRRGGLFIFDLRKNSGQDSFLEGFSSYKVVEDYSKYQRIICIK